MLERAAALLQQFKTADDWFYAACTLAKAVSAVEGYDKARELVEALKQKAPSGENTFWKAGFLQGKHLQLASFFLAAGRIEDARRTLGHTDSIGALAQSYARGYGVPTNHTEAIRWYRKGAEMGHSELMNALGICCKYGEGTAINHALAFAWFEAAAKAGSTYGMFNLAWYYADKRMSIKNESEAFAWYLGYAYRNGAGIGKSETEAFAWYKKAADLGHSYAMFEVGCCHEDGIGVRRNAKEAVKWYREAAQKGVTQAQERLRKKGLKW